MDEKYMLEAIRIALEASVKYDEVPIGCVIVKDGHIIASASNTKEQTHNVINHAEINALNDACKTLGDWRLNDCDLYVTLEPCLMCVGAIINYRIKNVYFGAYDLNGGAVCSSMDITKVKNLLHYPNFVGGILEDKCSSMLKEYFKSKRRK